MHIQDVSRVEAWVVARRDLVAELTRLRTQLYADPCALPGSDETPEDTFGPAGDRPPALLFGPHEHGAANWECLFDRLDGYLRTLH